MASILMPLSMLPDTIVRAKAIRWGQVQSHSKQHEGLLLLAGDNEIAIGVAHASTEKGGILRVEQLDIGEFYRKIVIVYHRIVVDSGLCRKLVYDARTGLSHLETVRISQDSVLSRR